VSALSEENVEVVREGLRRMTENGFAGVADLLADDFTMDSPHGVEARQAHDKKGVEEWFGKMDEVWEDGLKFEPEETPRSTTSRCSRPCAPVVVAAQPGSSSTR
jgi:hypothetical protein